MAAHFARGFGEIDVLVWKKLFSNYQKVFGLFCDNYPKKKDLKQLDGWYQNEFGNLIRERNPHHLVKVDLIKLMKWKLTRGKFRPRLTQMIEENKEEDIVKYSKEAFSFIDDDPKKSIQALCKLKAVGPATASAILTAYKPEKYAFMADEAVNEVLKGKIDYTLKYYMKYLDEVKLKAQFLTQEDTMTVWTPHQIEICLWTASVASRLKVNLEENNEKSTNAKRKSDQLQATNELELEPNKKARK